MLEILDPYIFIFLLVILLVAYFFLIKREIFPKKVFILIVLSLAFPLSWTYNLVYYTQTFTGILFCLLIVLIYFLIFRFIDIHRVGLYLYVLVVLLALIARLRSIFILLVLSVFILIFIELKAIKKIRHLIFLIFTFTAMCVASFIVLPITLKDYFMLENFMPEMGKNIFYFLLQYPRERPLLMIIMIVLIFFNVFYCLSVKDEKEKRKISLVICPELAIFFIYFLLFSNGDLVTAALYLGFFPFALLNLFYFFKQVDDFSVKNRNILLIFFAIISIISNINGYIFRFIDKKLY